MAKLYGEIASSTLMSFDKSFARLNGQPLDSSEVYYSLDAAKTYADDNKVDKTDIVDSQSVSESVEAASETKVLSEKAVLDMLTWKTIM